MKKVFQIPAENITDFAEALAEKELANEISGADDNGNINLVVHYNQDQRYDVFELTELVENDFNIY